MPATTPKNPSGIGFGAKNNMHIVMKNNIFTANLLKCFIASSNELHSNL
jgi:hypothetical protein